MGVNRRPIGRVWATSVGDLDRNAAERAEVGRDPIAGMDGNRADERAQDQPITGLEAFPISASVAATARSVGTGCSTRRSGSRRATSAPFRVTCGQVSSAIGTANVWRPSTRRRGRGRVPGPPRTSRRRAVVDDLEGGRDPRDAPPPPMRTATSASSATRVPERIAIDARPNGRRVRRRASRPPMCRAEALEHLRSLMPTFQPSRGIRRRGRREKRCSCAFIARSMMPGPPPLTTLPMLHLRTKMAAAVGHSRRSPDDGARDAGRLVFLIGAPRSGTTLLARMLSRTRSSMDERAASHHSDRAPRLLRARSRRRPTMRRTSRQAIHEVVSELPRGESAIWRRCARIPTRSTPS